MSDQIKTLVIEIIDRRASSWVLDGSEENGQAQRLDTATDRMMKATSAIKVFNNGKDDKGGHWLRKIRYIKGCDTIFVDEQEKRGVKPNKGVDSGDLFIKLGTKTIVRDGAEISLYEYIKNYEGNVDNPLRPNGAVDLFKELKSEEIAVASIDDFDAELEAKNYLSTLKNKDVKGKVTYKDKEIDFLASLFRLPALSTPAEKFAALIDIAIANPGSFNDSIANQKSGMLSEVNQGKQLGVFSVDSNRILLTNSDKVLLTTTSNKIDDQLQELAVYFLGKEGETSYKQFSIELTAAKERAIV